VIRNVFSQFGEDGILEDLFSQDIPGDIVEFGAHDGIRLRNTALLKRRTLLIESDPRTYQMCCENTDAVCLNAVVTPENINYLLESQGFTDLAVISIDIDSCDYFIWDALKCRPHVVIIETNGMPPDIYHADYNSCSLRACVELGATRGYGLHAYTGNAIFVRDYVNPDPYSLYVDPEYIHGYLETLGPDGKPRGHLYWQSQEYEDHVKKYLTSRKS